MSNEIITLESVIAGVAEVFDQVLVDRSINFKRESEFALQILYGNEYSRSLALANPQSVRDAVTNIAAIGLSLNPARKLAYLVPRDKKICLDISYMGLVEIATASNSILWVQGAVVYESETFHPRGIDQCPIHDRNPFAKEKGEIVGAYVVAKTHGGDYLTTAMSTEEINAIRDRLSAWKAWVSKKAKCPWVTDYVPMALKTVVKSASKLWPKSERLDKAIHYLNTDGGQGIDLSTESNHGADQNVIDAVPIDRTDVNTELARVAVAPDHAALQVIWKRSSEACRKASDQFGHARIKAAILARDAVVNTIKEAA